jgi:hypothetical protein
VVGSKFNILNRIISVGKEVIPALTDLSNDPAFSTRLTQAGGLISLLGIGLELYSKMREDSQTDEQMAFKSLYTIVFASSEALLIEISEKYLGGSDIGIDISKRKELMDNLFDAFKESSDDDFSHVEDLPAVKQFKTIIIKQLKDKYPEKKTIIDYFGLKFGTELDFKARTDDNIRKFYDWSATQEQYTLLKKYLERLVQKTEKEDVVSFTEKPLRERYIEHRLVCSDADTWLWSDREILNTTQQDIVYMDTLLKDFLSVPPSDKRYLIVGASFGIGKTWLVKRIASQSASNYINQADLTGSENGSYRPILVFLKHGLTVAYSEDDVDTILQEIVAPQDDKNPEVSSRKILLILDGLDEYRQDKEKLVNEKIRGEYRKRYPKMKVIITTRLQPKIRDLLHIEYDEYIRLLPFNSDQVDKVFKNYRVKLNYEGALQLGLHDDEITKPLFAWMFSSMFADTELKIEFKKDWTNNMRKTLIYMLFFHYIITGRYKSAFRKDAWNQLYTYEKKALRKIAALKMIYRDALQEDIIKNALEKFGPPTDVSNSADYVESILSSYCYLRFIKGKPSIEFIHESLKDSL